MRFNHITRLLAVVTLALLTIFSIDYFFPSEREQYEGYVNEHEYLQRDYKQVSSMKKRDRPDLAWELDFLLTMDPQTKQPERARLLETYYKKKAKDQVRVSVPGQSVTPWVERGPTNVGGRTRALAFDPDVSNKVWAGGVTGGLWYNSDITDANSNWVAIDDFWDNLSVTKIVFDPNNSSTIYVGTGEGWGASSTVGAGVWKSSNGGTTWTQLTATANYEFVNDLVVRDETSGVGDGVVYVASARSYHEGSFHGSNGMYRSSDGGTSFTAETSFRPTDLCIAPDNRIWSGTYDGRIMYSDNGTTWTEAYVSNMDRVAIDCAASDENYIYALIEDDDVAGEIVYTSNKGVSWNNATEPVDADSGIPSTDFTRGQAWYDLVIAVDPNDENTVVVGGIDLFRSTDNGTNWGQISRWYNFFGSSSAVVHADQHAIEFKGAGSDEVLFGNDGGVFYSEDLENAASGSEIDARNSNYNVTQFYSCAIHPDAGTDFFLAGTQDNGTQRFQNSGLNATVDVYGGDGGFCFIDQTDPDYQIVSYVYNVYGLSTNGGTSFNTDIQDDQSSGLFINPADYDDNLDILYSTKTSSTINRISGVTTSPTVGSISVALGSESSHLRVSPYTTSSTTLFAGTLAGRVFRIEDADGSTPSSTEITGVGFSTGSISCIELGASEDEILVTFSNYGVTSVWYTSDGGTSWSSKEGDLPDMPVRWALFNPNNRSEVILATELGVWRTSDISDTDPSWSSSNDGLANVRVDMLQLRDSDNEVIAATHGRGLFSSNGFGVETVPSADFNADVTVGCGTDLTVNFSDQSSGNPAITAWEWSFPGGTPSSSTDQIPPTVSYSGVGEYDVTLKVTNSLGESTELKSDYINIGTGFSLPFTESFESTTFPPDCWTTYTGTNGLGIGSEWVRSTVSASVGSASAYVEYESIEGIENTEDWLVTPLISLTGTFGSMLTFDAKDTYSDDYNSQYHVMISTTSQTDIASFTTLETYTESDFQATSFSNFTIDLSDYDGHSVYLAFVLEQLDGDDWYLDNVSIDGTVVSITADNGLEICEGETTILSVTSDPSYTYQWKLDGVDISEATASSYLPVVSGEYSTVVTANSVSVETETVGFIINLFPIISSQSSDIIICETDNTTLSVSVSDTEVSYQWLRDGNELSDDDIISGSITSVLTFENITKSNEGEYICVVSTNGCETESEPMTVTVEDIVQVTLNPSDVELCAAGDISFSVEASGVDLSYQWYFEGEVLSDNTLVSGSTTSVLSISDAFEDESGEYYCEISSACETVVSSEMATLEVATCLSSAKEQINSLRFYPNPTGGLIILPLNGISASKNVDYAIYRVDGRLMKQDVLSPSRYSNDKLTLDLSAYENGIYMITLNIDGHVSNQQIIKR